jgi:hypothetical protein
MAHAFGSDFSVFEGRRYNEHLLDYIEKEVLRYKKTVIMPKKTWGYRGFIILSNIFFDFRSKYRDSK